MKELKPVLLIYTGGTIGSQRTDKGFAPTSNFEQLLNENLTQEALDRLKPFKLMQLERLIDSSNARPSDWSVLANTIATQYADYSGFVILHGTDTMAYTASALSFLLPNLHKPVVITGSQIPLVESETDAIKNLTDAINCTRSSQHKQQYQQVCICFNGHVLQGNRATKVHTSDLTAFTSPNAVDLNAAEPRSNNKPADLLQPSTYCEVLPASFRNVVSLLYLYPGIPDGQIAAAFDKSIEGVIMLSFGAGNPPDQNSCLMAALAQAKEQNQVVINITQCHAGAVQQGTYATSAKLNELGVISGADMTLEAAYTKLHCLLATEEDPDAVRAKMLSNIAGELTLTKSHQAD